MIQGSVANRASNRTVLIVDEVPALVFGNTAAVGLVIVYILLADNVSEAYW